MPRRVETWQQSSEADPIDFFLANGRHGPRIFEASTEGACRPICRWRRVQWASITIESFLRTQPRRFYAATFLLPLPRRFHEQNFGPKSGRQKALENITFSRAYCLVAGIGFEPMTFRL